VAELRLAGKLQTAELPAPAADIFQWAGSEAVLLLPMPSKFSVTGVVLGMSVWPTARKGRNDNSRINPGMRRRAFFIKQSLRVRNDRIG
jgi:hypothetical protein